MSRFKSSQRPILSFVNIVVAISSIDFVVVDKDGIPSRFIKDSLLETSMRQFSRDAYLDPGLRS